MPKIKHWLQFFRLPNLPTAPGDALAGAVVVIAMAGGPFPSAIASGAAALFLYMYGLADNDVAGGAEDAESAPERPIPQGTISLRAAKIARSICLFSALLTAVLFNLPPAWWLTAVLLTGTICLYNRMKCKWLMGLCRGLSVLCGGVAVLPPNMIASSAVYAVGAMAFGWALYVTAVTKLSEGEDCDSAGLGAWRYALGLTALVPLAACVFFPDMRMLAMPLLGCIWACVAWCVIVWPLGRAHSSALRRNAVGRAIGALLYLQIGFLLIVPNREFVAVAVVLWLAVRFIRRLAPTISGS